MYFKETGTFINLRDIKTISINERCQIVISYLKNGGDLIINNYNLEQARTLMKKISDLTEEVQQGLL